MTANPFRVLADSWETLADGLTYTFHLNQNAKWHDGVDVTAEDVKFSFDAVLDPNTGSLYTTIVNEAVASYRVIDADTFEIVARDRFVSFLFNGPGSVFIIPKHIWETIDVSSWSFDGGSTGQDPARVVGSGPFKFKEWVQGERVTVVRNDAYYDVVPNIDELTLAIQPDAEAAVLALQGGETDVMEIIPPAQTQSVIDTPGRTVDDLQLLSDDGVRDESRPRGTPSSSPKRCGRRSSTRSIAIRLPRTSFSDSANLPSVLQPKLSAGIRARSNDTRLHL